ncbi:MAG: MlaD family protein [Gemmatimonadota bacterium]|nr:MlaD family protein [Gemmatimonadota bacterium]
MRMRNEVVVGIVVVAGLLVLAVGGYWLTGRPWGQEEQQVTAAFEDIGLLAPGNPVKYRGVNIGRVDEIDLAARGSGVLVTMTVNAAVPLPQDAGVVLSAESFFGDWQAVVVSRGRPEFRDLEFSTVPRRGVLPGATMPDITQLTAVAARIAGDIEVLSDRVQLAFTEETAVRIRETIENVQDMSERLNGFVDQQTNTYRDVSQNVLASTANIRDATAQAERVMADVSRTVNQGDVQQILANARLASANFNRFSGQLATAGQGIPGLVTRADTTLASIGGVVGGLNAQLAPTLQEAQAAMATLNRAATMIEQGNGSLGRLLNDPALYEETQRSIATLNRLMADIQANPAKYIGQFRIF